MWIEIDPEIAAFYIYLSGSDRDREGIVARTKEVEPGALMLDYDAAGQLVGVEVLSPELLGRVPGILRDHGIEIPERVHFDKLGEALAA